MAIAPSEVDYLIGILNSYFKVTLTPDDVRWSYSGVRPLFDDDAAKGASAVTRDYTFELDGGNGRAPILSAFGGKLTTYRKLAEARWGRLAPTFPAMGKAWTATAPFRVATCGGRFQGLAGRLPVPLALVAEPLARHYGHAYGTDADKLLAGANG